MIARPPSWIAVPGVRTQTLISPEGVDAAGIRYTERVRPLRRIGDIVGGWLHRKSRIGDPVVGKPERLETVEGEHAAFVVIDAAFDGKPVQASLGVVFGDDFYALVEGFALRADLFASTAAKVRELTIEDRHALGQRRRRYEHAWLPGWQPIVRGFTTEWIAPYYPLSNGLVATYAATPVDPNDEAVAGALVARAIERGFAPEAGASVQEVKNAHDLVGILSDVVVSRQDAHVLRSFVTLSDSRYLYSAELLARSERDWPVHKELFTQLWQSIVPIPQPRVSGSGARLFEFWAE